MVNLKWNGKNNINSDSELYEENYLPFQLVEYINSPLNDKLEKKKPIEDKKEWENFLILGDNKLAIDSLLKDFENKINKRKILILIDIL